MPTASPWKPWISKAPSRARSPWRTFASPRPALRQQAEIARAARRSALAANFERAAEMTALPQSVVMAVYERLRPGRARNKSELLAVAEDLRREHGAERLAAFVEEAAEVYGRRGLFKTRF